MRIADLYGHDEPVISFEFFPPKTEKGYGSLIRTIEELKEVGPAFVSVTMGAGGASRSKTVEIVKQIEREVGITAMCHVPCIGFSRAELSGLFDDLERSGIENVLALGGDPPRDAENFVQPDDGFRYANELVSFIRSGPWSFAIGGGCYPEGHPSATSLDDDLAHLVNKVEAGADFLITQLFFDNRDYYSFVARARTAGITVPIVPGIMPVVSASNIKRMAALSNARIPQELAQQLDRVAEDNAAVEAIGTHWASDQCRDLIANGAPGIHFYTLNRSPATREIHRDLFRSAGR